MRTAHLASLTTIRLFKPILALRRAGGSSHRLIEQPPDSLRFAPPSHPDLRGGTRPLSASDVDPEQKSVMASGRVPTVSPRPMTRDEIRQTVGDYARAARNATNAGFDGVQILANYLYLLAQFLNRATNRRTDEFGGKIEGRARILFDVVEAILDEVDPSKVGVKISPMHETGPFAANDETLPMAEYAIRELNGYGLSHLLLMGNTTDFTGTPLESLMGDGMFRHFRPIFKGTLIANVQMNAGTLQSPHRRRPRRSRGLRPTLHRQSRFGPTPQDRCAARRNRLGDRLCVWAQWLFRLPGSSAGNRLIPASDRLRRPIMSKTTPQQNKALVLEAFDTLFNRRDYDAAERFWSDRYIQHSAHIAPGRDGLFSLIRTLPDTLKYENQIIVAEGDYVIAHGRFSGNGRPAAWIAADVVRIEDGKLAEHWDVLQDEATQAQSVSGLPMFGNRFPD
jgi:predicted SnoaL-like aldol condensation-catalyzing enzyme